MSEGFTGIDPVAKSADDPRVKETVAVSADDYFFGLAEAAARRSKCRTSRVGAVLVDSGGTVRSIGGNTASGYSCCLDDGLSCRGGLHAEYNCIVSAHSTDCVEGTLYVTKVPCAGCLRLVWLSGVSFVFYPNEGVTTCLANPERVR